jgi:predicted NUDIX family NTP pyrophosphohydrolase
MSTNSAGILLFRYIANDLQVMLVHPGGPFWAKKNDGAWSIPKGLFEDGEMPLEAAKREFNEETGFAVDGEFIELGTIKQPSKKVVYAWALEQDLDVTQIRSNTFDLEWPMKSGKIQKYPEIDKGQWFELEEAKKKILKGQSGFIDNLVEKLGYVLPDKKVEISNEPIQGSLF